MNWWYAALDTFRRREKMEPMPGRFEALAIYNSEKHRGILHTPEHRALMADLQADFRHWMGWA